MVYLLFLFDCVKRINGATNFCKPIFKSREIIGYLSTAHPCVKDPVMDGISKFLYVLRMTMYTYIQIPSNGSFSTEKITLDIFQKKSRTFFVQKKTRKFFGH